MDNFCDIDFARAYNLLHCLGFHSLSQRQIELHKITPQKTPLHRTPLKSNYPISQQPTTNLISPIQMNGPEQQPTEAPRNNSREVPPSVQSVFAHLGLSAESYNRRVTRYSTDTKSHIYNVVRQGVTDRLEVVCRESMSKSARNIVIETCLSPDDESRLIRMFPGVPFELHARKVSDTPLVDADLRVTQNLLFQLAGSISTSFVEFGGNPLVHILDYRHNVHCCMASRSAHDIAVVRRIASEAFRLASLKRKGTDGNPGKPLFPAAVSFLQNKDLHFCTGNVLSCQVKAPAVVAVFGAGNFLSLQNMAKFMRTKEAKIAYVSIIYTPQMLYNDEGYIDSYDARYFIDRSANTLRIVFKNDVNRNQVYDYRAYSEYITKTYFRGHILDKVGNTYLKEIVDSQYPDTYLIKIVDLGPERDFDASETIQFPLWLNMYKGKTLVNVLELKSIDHNQADLSSYNRRVLVVDSELVRQTRKFCSSFSRKVGPSGRQERLALKDVFRHIYNRDSQFIVDGVSRQAKQMMTTQDQMALATALYYNHYYTVYEQGITAAIMSSQFKDRLAASKRFLPSAFLRFVLHHGLKVLYVARNGPINLIYDAFVKFLHKTPDLDFNVEITVAPSYLIIGDEPTTSSCLTSGFTSVRDFFNDMLSGMRRVANNSTIVSDYKSRNALSKPPGITPTAMDPLVLKRDHAETVLRMDALDFFQEEVDNEFRSNPDFILKGMLRRYKESTPTVVTNPSTLPAAQRLVIFTTNILSASAAHRACKSCMQPVLHTDYARTTCSDCNPPPPSYHSREGSVSSDSERSDSSQETMPTNTLVSTQTARRASAELTGELSDRRPESTPSWDRVPPSSEGFETSHVLDQKDNKKTKG
ncbi:hypothetical protein BD408DRAFT_430307 [Parasitella parasitica]|nr:hypothetical protein BD408DRAFT_430307 [Parasitella parasitica]